MVEALTFGLLFMASVLSLFGLVLANQKIKELEAENDWRLCEREMAMRWADQCERAWLAEKERQS